MAAFDFPNSPSNGDTYSANGIDWIYNGSVWKKDATAGVKGQKGEVGVTGDKGQKGEKGDKGQKGEDNSTKGQKGEIGATGGTGGTGTDGDKGQKGEVGSSGSTGIPSGFIGLWSGAANAIPSGWYLCDGNNGTPNLRGKFIVGYDNNDSDFDVNDTGGSKDATLVSHSHTVDNHTHTFSGSGSHSHSHTTNDYVGRSNYAEPRNFGVGTDGNLNSTGGTTSATVTISISGNTGGSTPNTNAQGSSATNANLPPYYALCYIMKS